MGVQSEDRGAEDEITCLFLGGRPCLGKAKGRGGPASSGGDQADPGNRRRGGGSPGRRALRPPCSNGCGGTSRRSWVRSQPWSAGDWIFSRARKWRFRLQWGNRCWNIGPVGAGHHFGIGNKQLAWSVGLGWQGNYAHHGYPANYNRYWNQEAPRPIFHTSQLY